MYKYSIGELHKLNYLVRAIKSNQRKIESSGRITGSSTKFKTVDPFSDYYRFATDNIYVAHYTSDDPCSVKQFA